MNAEIVNMKYPLPKMPPDSFTWDRWRLGIQIWIKLSQCRYWQMLERRDVLREHAVGYHPSEYVCKPKKNQVAVLFFIDEEYCWAHFRMREYMEIFADET